MVCQQSAQFICHRIVTREIPGKQEFSLYFEPINALNGLGRTFQAAPSSAKIIKEVLPFIAVSD